MDYKGATSPLEQWVGLAVREAKIAYRSELKEEEKRYFDTGGVKKSGARVRMLERSASSAVVKLSSQFLAEADALEADLLSIEQAQSFALGFFDFIEREAMALASYVRPTQSVFDATTKLLADLRADFVARTSSFLSKRKIQRLGIIADPSLQHRYDEVLHAVQSRHVQLEEQFRSAGRDFENGSFVGAQLTFANDRVVEFIRELSAQAGVEPSQLRAVGLQLHSEAIARTYMHLRRDEFGELRMMSNECAAVFSNKRKEGIERITRQIALSMPQTHSAPHTVLVKSDDQRKKPLPDNELSNAWRDARAKFGEGIRAGQFKEYLEKNYPDNYVSRSRRRNYTAGRFTAGRPKDKT
jgi:hypothetical protein